MTEHSATPASWHILVLLLGVSLGGFFDGILLHQILQWHHLLSLVPGMTDLRLQILWDGVFHCVMYLIAVLALCGLWRRRRVGESSRRTFGSLCAGFGLWHVLDALISHWLLGIHRIRPESDMPLAWDLGWLAAFGLLPLIGGYIFFRGPQGPGRGRSSSLVAYLVLITLSSAVWALQPPAGAPLTTVIFAPWMPPDIAEATLRSAGAGIVWSDPEIGISLVRMEPGQRWVLWRQAAVFVSGAGMPEGCFGWSTTG